jgi:predicted acylesterase/phospholipase RssA
LHLHIPICPEGQLLTAGLDNKRLSYETCAVMGSLRLLRSARRVGYLFSGGSARCVFQVGVVETLHELGIRPSVCLGVSVGAWNAAAVSVGNVSRLRAYWRFFCRMPSIDLTNLWREQSPFIWSRLHEKAFARYVGAERLRHDETLPLLVGLTRLRDRKRVIADVRSSDDPLQLLIASNYLPPFYTRPPLIGGERYGDGAFVDNLPYDALIDECDAIVIMASKGESEGGLYRSSDDFDHEIPLSLRDRIVVIRPRHRMPLGFIERRWERLDPIATLGALRTREVLLGEEHPETSLAARGTAITLVAARARRWLRNFRPANRPARDDHPPATS